MININSLWSDYELIDCGDFEKLERFGDYVIARPEPQALWDKSLTDSEWESRADAYFRRTNSNNFERGEWFAKPSMSETWNIKHNINGVDITMRLAMTSFKHLGIFPEQADNWKFISNALEGSEGAKVLNLFAYTGGATLAARAVGAAVTHVDSVKQVVSWSRNNMELSGLSDIRWIVDDARKFVIREVKRGNKYRGIILDPPAYGRGPDGEKWILEEDIVPLLTNCSELLEEGGFVVFNLYSMGLSALLAKGLLEQIFKASNVEFGEFYFEDNFKKILPLGVYARFNGSTVK